VTQDSAHAVKLLRLKSLLPESLLTGDIERVVSVLEMSHWDVARAAAFLMDSNTTKPKGVVKVKCRSEITIMSRRSEYSTSVSNNNFDSNDNTNNNSITSTVSSSSNINSSNGNHGDDINKDYMRPTRV